MSNIISEFLCGMFGLVCPVRPQVALKSKPSQDPKAETAALPETKPAPAYERVDPGRVKQNTQLLSAGSGRPIIPWVLGVKCVP
jgi:hypothetical protein